MNFDFQWIFKFLWSDTQLSLHSNTCCVRRYTTVSVHGHTTYVCGYTGGSCGCTT